MSDLYRDKYLFQAIRDKYFHDIFDVFDWIKVVLNILHNLTTYMFLCYI